MKDIEPADVAKAQLEELIHNQRLQSDRGIAASRRWSLSLAVGNGASLAALGAKILDVRSDTLTSLLMPSAWLFVFGLICGALTARVAAARHQISFEIWQAYTIAFRRGQDLEFDTKRTGRDKKLYWLETALECVSALCFLVGLAYPLLMLWCHFKATGHWFMPTP